MLKFTTGNMFETPADIRINTVNCVGVMGAGVALGFKKKYPEMFKDYLKACQAKEVRPGKIHVWINNDAFDPITIVNFPTKDHWKNPSKYSYIEDGLTALHDFLISQPNAKVTIPALGCGNGGLDWKTVKGMIESKLCNLENEILVYEPNDSFLYSQKIDSITQKFLNDNNVSVLTPANKYFPSVFRGKSAKSYYLIGNENTLDRPRYSWIISRKPSAREQNAINICIDSLVNENAIPVLGSSASEREIIEHYLKSEKPIIFIADVGLLNFQIPKALENIWNPELITVISPFPLDAQNSSYNGVAVLETKLAFSNTSLITTENLGWTKKLSKSISSHLDSSFCINYNIEENIPILAGLGLFLISKNSYGSPKLNDLIAASLILRQPLKNYA